MSAASAVLMDADSGRILYGCREDDPRPIASITKLMTAMVALESGRALTEVVTIHPEWTGIEGSSLYLKPGETIRLETLLYGLLLRSGNDAAMAVAGFCCGSTDAFVDRMNTKARELGMENTHFANPSGLDDEGHYSTARDMALLARAFLENDALARITASKSVTLEGRLLTNHNKLLWRYEGCVGLKTGYTQKAGRTLVSAAKRDGMTLICVTLNAPNDWQDHKALFDYGFEMYERYCLVQKEETLCHLPVTGSLLPICEIVAEKTLLAVVEKGSAPTVKLVLDCERIVAPVQAGTSVGRAVFLLDGNEIGSCRLKLKADVPENTAAQKFDLMRLFGR